MTHPRILDCGDSEKLTPKSELDINVADLSLLTDLYQLTMSVCYVGEDLAEHPACFELFVRRLPSGFNYLVAMGLSLVLDYLEQFRFTSDQIAQLKATGIFDGVGANFWSLLETGSFTGEVWAVPEGTIILPNEPIIRIEAPLWQAQIIETFLLNTINYQTLIATRAARLRDIAGDDATLLEFGTRRAFGPQASLWAAKAALSAGFDGTSNVLAALKLGTKPSGTMAHALVMALKATKGGEMEAYDAFHKYFPRAPLLIDTYDPIAAATKLADKMKAGDFPGVRIDSGDLVILSKEVSRLLPGVSILVSGDLDEREIARLKSSNAPINGYGIGTKLVTGTPVNGVYKLVEIDGIGVMKESDQKITYPGRKQIFRTMSDGVLLSDRLGLMSDDPISDEEPLLKLVYQQKQRLIPKESIDTISRRTRMNVLSLPLSTRQIDNSAIPPVILSDSLQQLITETKLC